MGDHLPFFGAKSGFPELNHHLVPTLQLQCQFEPVHSDKKMCDQKKLKPYESEYDCLLHTLPRQENKNGVDDLFK